MYFFVQILTSQTGDQPYSDTSHYKVSEYSLIRYSFVWALQFIHIHFAMALVTQPQQKSSKEEGEVSWPGHFYAQC